MIFEGAELYNISALEQCDDGMRMLRVPPGIRDALSEQGKKMSAVCAGAEIRFFLKGDKAILRLSALEGSCTGRVQFYQGDFPGGCTGYMQNLNGSPIIVHLPEKADWMQEERKSYASSLIRILLPREEVHIQSVEGDIYPPGIEDKPSKRWLAYGSSITHGSIGAGIDGSFLFRAAAELRVDPLNLGFAGSAMLEPEMADYIAGRKDWDFATIELGTNACGVLAADELRKRTVYFIRQVASAGKPFGVIDMLSMEENEAKNDYRSFVKNEMAQLGIRNAIYIDGRRLLKSRSELTADGIHPGGVGHERIAQRLVRIIREESGEDWLYR